MAKLIYQLFLKALAEREINEVWLEAGEGLNGAFLKANLIDVAHDLLCTCDSRFRS